jgi:hypothetical protein
LQLALVFQEGVLVEFVYVAQQPGRAGQSAHRGGTLRPRQAEVGGLPRRRRFPVIGLNESGQDLLPLEGQLLLRHLRHRGRLLEKEAVDLLHRAAHPLVQIVVCELLDGEEVEDLTRMLDLQSRDGAFLRGNPHLVLRQADLLFADPHVLSSQVFLEPPLFRPPLETSQKRVDLHVHPPGGSRGRNGAGDRSRRTYEGLDPGRNCRGVLVQVSDHQVGHLQFFVL